MTYQQVIDTHREHPDWNSHQIAAALGCLSGYVRATAQRRKLALPKIERKKKQLPAKIKKLKTASTSVDALGIKEQLVEDLFSAFDELFIDHAVFDIDVPLAEEFHRAQKQGQSITGFIFGDPLPRQSALAKRNKQRKEKTP